MVKTQKKQQNIKDKSKFLTEQEKLTQIRKAAVEEVKKLKKEGKGITTNSVEVVCREEDIFQPKNKKK